MTHSYAIFLLTNKTNNKSTMKKTNMAQVAKITAAFLMLIATLGSCQKGDTGPAGAAGATGAAGTNGTNGSANVNAGTVSTNSSSWVWNSTEKADGASFIWSGITQGIVDSGTVFAYLSNGNGGWVALPYTEYSTGGVSISYYYIYALNSVEIWVSNSDNTDISSTLNASSSTFKFLTVSPALRRANPNTNWNIYEEAQAAVNNIVSLQK